LTIDQIVRQLEIQKRSIESAIAALKQVSDLPLMLSAAGSTESQSGQRKRGRPSKNQSGPAERRTRPTYTDDFRRQVVAALRDGSSIGQAAKQFNTTWFTVREWANSGKYEPAAATPAKASKRATGASKKRASKSAGKARRSSRKAGSKTQGSEVATGNAA